MKRAEDLVYLSTAPKAVERLSRSDLPADLLSALRALHRQDDRYAARFGVHAALLLSGASIAAWTQALELRVLGCLLEVIALIGLSVGLHEASHGRLLSRRWANDLVGLLCGLPLLLPVMAFRTNHLDHHRRRGCGARAMPEVLDFAVLRSLPVYVLGVAAKSFGFVTVLPVIALVKSRGRARARTIGEYLLVIAIVTAAGALIGWHQLVRLWFLPLAVTALFSQIRAVAEHGLTLKGNTFTASRTVVSGRVVSYLMCNINYHLEHHLCPNLPWYRLPAAHRLLADVYRRSGASVYASYRHFFLDFLRSAWRGIRPDHRLVNLAQGTAS
jgi:fatty acid desaturase